MAGLAVVLLVFVIGWIDLSHTSDQALALAKTGDFAGVRRLEGDFDRRAWLYGGVAAVAMALATAGALARSTDRRRVFSQAGVIGVLLGLGGLVVYVFNAHGGVTPKAGPLLAPSLLLLVLAAVGGTVTRMQEPTQHERQPLKRVATAALTCTGLTVALAYAYAGQQDGSCDTPTASTLWTGLTGWGAVVTAIAAFLLGLAGLAAGRWFVALVCIVVNPVALLYMVASSGAFC